MAAQPQKPITSQFMFDSIERALELVCAIEQQQGLLPSGGVDTDQYPQCCRDGPNQMFHVNRSLSVLYGRYGPHRILDWRPFEAAER